jgi:diacylglycerol kinase (ATP)
MYLPSKDSMVLSTSILFTGGQMKHIFIINPTAGKSAAEKEILPAIQSAFERSDFPYATYITKGINDAESYARDQCKEGSVVRLYACGGDGTLNEVANGAYGFKNAEIGIIPAGTGNDFVKTFSNYSYFNDIKRQVAGESITIDLLSYNGRIGVNVCNIGFDSAVAAEIDHLKRYPFLKGSLAYNAGIAHQFFKYKGDHLKVIFDDGTFFEDDFFLMAIGIGSYYGGGFCALPLADRQGEMLDVCMVNKIGRIEFLGLIKDYKAGKHIESPKFKNILNYKKCRSVQIEPVETIRLCADGEVTPANKVYIKVLPKAIKLSVPQGCSLITK